MTNKNKKNITGQKMKRCANTDNKGKLFVMLFADSEPSTRISFNLKPGYAPLQVIKLSIPRQFVAPG
jgi:hypothetical protein